MSNLLLISNPHKASIALTCIHLFTFARAHAHFAHTRARVRIPKFSPFSPFLKFPQVLPIGSPSLSSLRQNQIKYEVFSREGFLYLQGGDFSFGGVDGFAAPKKEKLTIEDLVSVRRECTVPVLVCFLIIVPLGL